MIDSLRLIDFAQATLHPTKVNELIFYYKINIFQQKIIIFH